MAGTICLLHFERPFRHAKHYLGYSAGGRLEDRLAEHGGPDGANLMRHVAAAGIAWTLARTWQGDRTSERQLKRQGGRTRLCPICRAARCRGTAAARSTPPPSGDAPHGPKTPPLRAYQSSSAEVSSS